MHRTLSRHTHSGSHTPNPKSSPRSDPSRLRFSPPVPPDLSSPARHWSAHSPALDAIRSAESESLAVVRILYGSGLPRRHRWFAGDPRSPQPVHCNRSWLVDRPIRGAPVRSIPVSRPPCALPAPPHLLRVP